MTLTSKRTRSTRSTHLTTHGRERPSPCIDPPSMQGSQSTTLLPGDDRDADALHVILDVGPGNFPPVATPRACGPRALTRMHVERGVSPWLSHLSREDLVDASLTRMSSAGVRGVCAGQTELAHTLDALLRAMQATVSARCTITATSILSLTRRAAVIEAYRTGLEASVARDRATTVYGFVSFALRPVNVEVDRRTGQLGGRGPLELRGPAAMEQAVLAPSCVRDGSRPPHGHDWPDEELSAMHIDLDEVAGMLERQGSTFARDSVADAPDRLSAGSTQR